MSEKRLLRDMLAYLEQIRAFAEDGRDTMLSSTKTLYAVIYAYQVVGEIAKRLPESFRNTHSQVNWRKLINFRDFLAHNYEKIAAGSVWTAVEALPELLKQIQALHDSLDSE